MMSRSRHSLCVLVTALLAGGPASAGQGDSPVKLSITPDGRLTLNGRPYFFIGFAPGPPLDFQTPEGGDGWAEMAEGGMSVVRGGASPQGWTPAVEEQFSRYLDAAHQRGVYVWPFLREMVDLNKPEMREKLETFIRKYRGHPGILFWKSADEPEWGKLPVEPLKQAYDLICELDPDRLVWFCHAPRGTLETLRPYSAACDVLSIDVYPVSEPPGKHSLEANKGLSMVGDYTRRTVELAKGGKMPFMVLQACWSGVNPAHNPKNRLMFPTFRQERYMLYQAIICGANSVSFFGMPVGLTGHDAELGWNWTFWRAVLKPLLAEIKPGSELYPVLTSPDSEYPLEFTGAPQIEARWKEASVYLYILVAAREGETARVTFSGLQDGEVTVLHESRTLQAVDGSFTDTFAPHDVHIYRALRVMPSASGPAPR
ncbi:MAG: hypothetical protein GX616_25010 [Planctomycetes bacterium]|nr:hypothetical protein [Planctomycetota bacterium]